MSKAMKEFKNKTRNNSENFGKKKPYNNNKPRKTERFRPTTFRKTITDLDMDAYGNVYMKSALTDFYGICTDIEQFFDYELIGISLAQLTADDCKNVLINQFTKNVPEMKIGGENQFWSINVSSNRCVIKTDLGFQFGWTLKVGKENKDEYESLELIYTAFSPKVCPEAVVSEEYGWEADTY